ncbi:MAG: hypothetical protein M1821_006633 [Bathelium mastoideum]|nr:MAG: hypothetical protein M1821_006633 [Bathelium mastoideum]
MAKGLALAQCCPICDAKRNLSRCSACHVVSYCSREHQVGDRKRHKQACNAVKTTQKRMDYEEQALRAHPGDFSMPANVFEAGKGSFYSIYGTRDYMAARFALVEALLKNNTLRAVEAALDHLLDMLQLCRGDNMGVRDLVPPLYLRLGKDQESYDFVKWWGTTAQEKHYRWRDLGAPYLDVKDADVFESVKTLCRGLRALSHIVSLTLIKIRLLLDLEALENSQCISERLPQEVLDNIKGHLVGPIVARNKGIMSSNIHHDRVEQLRTQMDQLYGLVKARNEHFWPALLHPGQHLHARPEAYTKGGTAEMQLALQYCYASWIETPGAINVIRDLMENEESG